MQQHVYYIIVGILLGVRYKYCILIYSKKLFKYIVAPK